jgi:crossover junction endodeoxyribonuclease RuvC
MTPRTNFMAIDPGAISGAYAVFYGDDGHVDLGDLPVVDKQLDAGALGRIVRLAQPAYAVVEKVGSMPKQGVASTFKFGVAVGIIHGVLTALGVPLFYVTPQVWKRHHTLLGKDKEASRALAQRLFPVLPGLSRVRDQGRAEALLIGLWHASTGYHHNVVFQHFEE